MMETVADRLGVTPVDIVVVVVSAVVVYAVVIVATRAVGLRSFSKLSAFDFAMTVAVGSVLAAVTTGNVALLQGLLAIVMLFVLQYTIAFLRRRTGFSALVDNRPLLLMHGPAILHEHLARARITEDDLRAKLREANVLSVDEIQAVVLETTGDVSVLVGDHLDPDLLEGVIGRERLTG